MLQSQEIIIAETNSWDIQHVFVTDSKQRLLPQLKLLQVAIFCDKKQETE